MSPRGCQRGNSGRASTELDDALRPGASRLPPRFLRVGRTRRPSLAGRPRGADRRVPGQRLSQREHARRPRRRPKNAWTNVDERVRPLAYTRRHRTRRGKGRERTKRRRAARHASADGAHPSLRNGSRALGRGGQDPGRTASVRGRRSGRRRRDGASQRRRLDHQHAPRPRPPHRQRRCLRPHVRRALRPRHRLLPRQGRQHAHFQHGAWDARRQRHRRRRAADCGRCRLLHEVPRYGPRGDFVLRRRRQQRGRLPRGREHGRAVQAAGDLPLREQRLRRVHRAEGPPGHRRCGGSRRRLRDAGRGGGRHGRGGGVRSRRRRHRTRPGQRWPDAAGGQDVPLLRPCGRARHGPFLPHR